MTEFGTPKRRRFPFVLGVLLVGLGLGYSLVQARLSQPDILGFAEAKASEILKTETKIGKLRFLPPAQLALQGIEMKGPASYAGFSLGEIKELILGYGLLNLIRRDFRIPSTVILNQPTLRFQSGKSPFPFLESVSDKASGGFLGRLGIRDGEFHYPWGATGKELVLSNVQFKAQPDPTGRIQVKLAAKLGGVAEGAIEVVGETDTEFRRYELQVRVEDVTFLPESQVPLRRVRGEFRISDTSIDMEGLTSLFHDWSVQWKGKVENWQGEPKLTLSMTHKKGRTPFRLSLEADLVSQKLSGEWFWIGRAYSFHGQVAREGEKFFLRNLELPHGYTGQGEIDGSNGNYVLGVSQESRRFQIRSNLSRLEFDTEFQLDHARINHLDWVVLGKVRLLPVPKTGRDSGPRFRGEIQTDYLIIEYEPLENFQGSFELSSDGFDKLDFRWGGVFNLNGRILFQAGSIREDVAVRVEEFPLGEIRGFAGHPLPSNLNGVLEGKLKLRGEWERPEVQGFFTVKEGSIDQVEFDRAVIQFQGFPPYLELHDSKIFKGRNTFKLTGAIDLRIQNFFHGIQIQRPDHFVIWKGMSIYWKGEDSKIEAVKPMGGKVDLGIDVGTSSRNSDGEDSEESHALVGPKIRF